MTTITEKLTRTAAFRENMDPMGTRWGISLLEGTSLYKVGQAPEALSGPVVIPKHYPHVDGKDSGITGMFTKPEYAQKAIEQYLIQAWDMAESKEQRKVRKDYAAQVEKTTDSPAILERL